MTILRGYDDRKIQFRNEHKKSWIFSKNSLNVTQIDAPDI